MRVSGSGSVYIPRVGYWAFTGLYLLGPRWSTTG
jgi:hypothetical protein